MASRYDHRQLSPLGALFVLIGGGLVVATTGPEEAWVATLLWVVAAIFALCALSFWSLRVQIETEHLRASFGPLPVFRKKIPLAQIERVEVGKTDLLDGWGIHFVPGRGWTWNLWGFRCVVLTLTDPSGRKKQPRTFRLGSDEPEELHAALQRAVPSANRTDSLTE